VGVVGNSMPVLYGCCSCHSVVLSRPLRAWNRSLAWWFHSLLTSVGPVTPPRTRRPVSMWSLTRQGHRSRTLQGRCLVLCLMWLTVKVADIRCQLVDDHAYD